MWVKFKDSIAFNVKPG
jgi:DNA primase large subunit